MAVSAAKQAAVSTASPRLFASPEKRTVILCLVLTAFTLFLYNAVAHHDFVNYDDDRYILTNQHVQAGLTWDTFVWALRSFEQANWHPLTWLSHALDCELFHLNPAGHHYVNVLWHALNVLLVLLLLQYATKSTRRSLMVAALFAAHPVNVESVAWVAERKNVLCTFFFLLTLAAYGYYLRKPQVSRYLAIVVLFALGLMAKPMVITLPFVLLLLDYWPLGRIGGSQGKTWTELVLEKLPLFLMSAVSAVVTIIAQSSGGAVRGTAESPLALRLENAVVSCVLYLGKAVWPSHLAPMYPRPVTPYPIWEVIGSALVLLLITFLVLKSSHRPYLVVGWLFFVGTLVPMSGLVQVGEQAMADRYAYIPFLGFFVAATWGFADLVQSRRIPALAVTSVSLVVITLFAAVTSVQIRYWQDSFTLWSHALTVTRNNYIAEDNLGSSLVMLGRKDDAIAHFEAAARINPRDPMANLNIGAYHQENRDFPAAIKQYQLVLTLTSDPSLKSNALCNLAMVYRLQGNYGKSGEYYQEALKLDPENASTLLGLGLLAQKSGDLAGAARFYSHALSRQPTDVGFLLLAQALEANGRSQEAQAAFEQAKQISTDFGRAQANARELLQ